MISRTPDEFQNNVLNEITLSPMNSDYCTIFKNNRHPELGYFIKYEKEGYYKFCVGDYSISKDFSLCFNHNEELMRFGTVYKGETEFEIENSIVSSFSPSSFFVIEKDLKGRQVWTKGMHFHGAEITIYKKFFDNIIKSNFPEITGFDEFSINYTYKYLPLEIVSIIQQLRSMAEAQVLTPLYLESKILECISLLNKEITSSPKNAFSNQIDYGKIKIGENRYVSLTFSDISSIQQAHDILTKEACNPPTIKSLSKRVFLNEQKLKAGFKLKYHMSINEYTTCLRMTTAENLLSTTDLSIDEISKLVGYNYSGNFIKMFKKLHGKTPLSFKYSKNDTSKL